LQSSLFSFQSAAVLASSLCLSVTTEKKKSFLSNSPFSLFLLSTKKKRKEKRKNRKAAAVSLSTSLSFGLQRMQKNTFASLSSPQ
jgi:hypothetical protein